MAYLMQICFNNSARLSRPTYLFQFYLPGLSLPAWFVEKTNIRNLTSPDLTHRWISREFKTLRRGMLAIFSMLKQTDCDRFTISNYTPADRFSWYCLSGHVTARQYIGEFCVASVRHNAFGQTM
jgi:hypothetical protein